MERANPNPANPAPFTLAAISRVGSFVARLGLAGPSVKLAPNWLVRGSPRRGRTYPHLKTRRLECNPCCPRPLPNLWETRRSNGLVRRTSATNRGEAVIFEEDAAAPSAGMCGPRRDGLCSGTIVSPPEAMAQKVVTMAMPAIAASRRRFWTRSQSGSTLLGDELGNGR